MGVKSVRKCIKIKAFWAYILLVWNEKRRSKKFAKIAGKTLDFMCGIIYTLCVAKSEVI